MNGNSPCGKSIIERIHNLHSLPELVERLIILKQTLCLGSLPMRHTDLAIVKLIS